MRVVSLTLLVFVFTSCVSALREREADCLAAMMADVWEAEEHLRVIEEAWRRAQLDSPPVVSLSASGQPRTPPPPPLVPVQAGPRRGDFSHLSFGTEQERSLYGSVIAARSRMQTPTSGSV